MTIADLNGLVDAGLCVEFRAVREMGLAVRVSLGQARWSRLSELAAALVAHGAMFPRGRMAHPTVSGSWTLDAILPGGIPVTAHSWPPRGTVAAPALPPPVEV